MWFFFVFWHFDSFWSFRIRKWLQIKRTNIKMSNFCERFQLWTRNLPLANQPSFSGQQKENALSSLEVKFVESLKNKYDQDQSITSIWDETMTKVRLALMHVSWVPSNKYYSFDFYEF